jgi:hypothetical protein
MTPTIETSDIATPDSLDVGRRSLLKMTTTGIAAAGVGAIAATPAHAQPQTQPAVKLTEKWDKVFPQSDEVQHKKITFQNRYGITLAGDLYQPKNTSGKLAALAVSGPFGAVKEQSSGLYAQTMAERGFITLAFDPSYTGESSGTPRNVASPDISVEDFSAAVDCLGLLPNVDRERIGIIGICGWGGMALSAAAVDKRIKAVVASTMYDMTRVMSKGYNDSVTLDSARRCWSNWASSAGKTPRPASPPISHPTTSSRAARRSSLSSTPTTTARRAATTRARSTPATPGQSPRRFHS